MMDVSRETKACLEQYEVMLRKWNKRINLVSKSDIDVIRCRHIEDSISVFRSSTRETQKWCDLGSGGGFPGLVVMIMGHPNVTLIEADKRKAEFLKSVIRELDLPGNVIADRIERAPLQHAGVVSARALAPLNTLLGYATQHLESDGEILVSKGAGFREEIDQAFRDWRFEYDVIPSKTEPRGAVLRIRNVEHA